MKPIILASASPRRKKLFDQMNIPISVIPSSIEEYVDEQLTPGEIVCSLARQKGEDVAKSQKNAIIISADTIVVYNSSILGKPGDEHEAAQILQLLGGEVHSVYSGVHIIENDHDMQNVTTLSFYERTKVTFSPLDELEIERYIQTGSPMDKAGAYGIQDDMGSIFVEKIEGDYYNVVGFPINAFYQNLKNRRPELFSKIFNT